MTRRLWFVVVPMLALLALALRSTLFSGSSRLLASGPTVNTPPPGKTLDVPTGAAFPPAARPATAGSTLPVLAEDDEDAEWRARATASTTFLQLPPSDQAWVLGQARTRVDDPRDPELEQVVQELSEVRLFVVSEREEPLAVPPREVAVPPGPSR